MNLFKNPIFIFLTYLLGLYEIFLIYFKSHRNSRDVILNTSIGDDVYGLAYMRSFKTFYKCKVRIHCLRSHIFIAKGFTGSNDEIVAYERNSLNWKGIQSIQFHTSLIKLAKVLKIYSVSPAFYASLNNIDTRNCLVLIRDLMLNIPQESKFEYPVFPSKIVSAISNFEEISPKIIVLNTESRSINNDGEKLFQEIARDLNKRGYAVYTNVVGQQKPIEGTTALNCSLEEFVEICKHVKAVISVRTGLLDLAVNTPAPKFVIYFSLKMKERRDITFYSRYTFDAWNVNNITEHRYKDFDDCYNQYIRFIESI